MQQFSADRVLSLFCLLLLLINIGLSSAQRTSYYHPSGHVSGGHHYNQPLMVPPMRGTSPRTPTATYGRPVNPPVPNSNPHSLPSARANATVASSSIRPPAGANSTIASSSIRPNAGASSTLATGPVLNCTTAEKQLQAFTAHIEVLTSTINDLDEAVQQLRPLNSKGCDSVSKPSEPSLTSTSQAPTLRVSDGPRTENSFIETSTESFTDPPPVENRGRRSASESPHFGMPSVNVNSPTHLDQAADDLAKASSDLKALRKDLSHTAEMLKQTNNSVHSALLRALQAYVTSIERRVDYQRQLHTQTRGTAGLKGKISIIKERVATLMEKLRSHLSNP